MHLHLLPLSDTWVLPRPFATALRGSALTVQHTARKTAAAAPALWQTSLAEIETARRSDRIVTVCAVAFGLLVTASLVLSGIVSAGLLGPRGIEFVVNTLLLK